MGRRSSTRGGDGRGSWGRSDTDWDESDADLPERDPLRWEPIYVDPADDPGQGSGGTGARWTAIALAVLALTLVIWNWSAIVGCLDAMTRIGPGTTDGEKGRGLVILGVVLVSILAAMRIALEALRRGDR